ncbi:MAG: FdtA/QdtA family cupin domain-containing protein [Candidatus Paceibacterota bacterium]
MEKEEIIVKNSGWVKLSAFPDKRGLLVVGEIEEEIPFAVKRIFYITDLENSTHLERGGHAHRKTDQIIFCLKGSFLLGLDDGEIKQEILLNDHTIGVRLGPSLWHTMKNFSSDCVILVLANQCYEKFDYLRDYSQFLEFIKESND